MTKQALPVIALCLAFSHARIASLAVETKAVAGHGKRRIGSP